jgi:hypothetical protein
MKALELAPFAEGKALPLRMLVLFTRRSASRLFRVSRNPIHSLIPFAVRVWLRQQKRRVENRRTSGQLARERGRLEDFPVEVARRESPLKRTDAGSLGAFTAEKTENLRIACEALNGLLLAPGQLFSFCESVGPTTRRRGFQCALEMRDGKETASPGGGLCQLANHLMLRTEVTDSHLCTAIRTPEPLPFACRLVETDHHFVRRADGIHRCNKLWLDKTVDGASTRSLLYENDCRVLYPADHLVRSDESEPS